MRIVRRIFKARAGGPPVSPASVRYAKGITALKMNSQQAHDLAEASFKKKESQLREGQEAMAEYHKGRVTIRERTARLGLLDLPAMQLRRRWSARRPRVRSAAAK
jgi:hypothetical protein